MKVLSAGLTATGGAKSCSASEFNPCRPGCQPCLHGTNRESRGAFSLPLPTGGCYATPIPTNRHKEKICGDERAERRRHEARQKFALPAHHYRQDEWHRRRLLVKQKKAENAQARTSRPADTAKLSRESGDAFIVLGRRLLSRNHDAAFRPTVAHRVRNPLYART